MLQQLNDSVHACLCKCRAHISKLSEENVCMYTLCFIPRQNKYQFWLKEISLLYIFYIKKICKNIFNDEFG